MHDASLLIFLYTETPLHVGCGEGLGAVDLPIMREKLSDLPIVPGSGLKGALREVFEPGGEATPLSAALFGPQPPEAQGEDTPGDGDAGTHAGAMLLLDARLLLLPVRSVFGGFAWVTSPLALGRLARDLERLLRQRASGNASATLPSWHSISVKDASPDELETALVGRKSSLTQRNELLIEDLPYRPVSDPRVDSLAETLANALPEGSSYDAFRERLPRHLMVVSDAELAELSRRYVEIVTRTRIDPKTGTVKKGALWTEENLPSEALLWSVADFERSRVKGDGANAASMRRRFLESEAIHARRRLRIGGNRTVGRGLVGFRVARDETLLGEVKS